MYIIDVGMGSDADMRSGVGIVSCIGVVLYWHCCWYMELW